MTTVKFKPGKISRLMESGVARVEDNPNEIRRRSRTARERSAELLSESKKLLAIIRKRRAEARGAAQSSSPV